VKPIWLRQNHHTRPHRETSIDLILADLVVWLSAVVEGYAIGGGAELATASDYRLMTPSSRIQFVQAKMGVSTGKAALMACEQ
jgi:enoyl-CoA hydratase/carnithine racemase